MASEIQVRVGLGIRKDNLQYQSQPQAFNADMVTSTPKGPVPGAFSVSVDGTACDLSQLTTPGFAKIQNLDSTNYVEYGIRDVSSNLFYPLGELLPGEVYVLRFSRNLLEEYDSPGTGTTGPVNQLWFKANTAACVVTVEAFEK